MKKTIKETRELMDGLNEFLSEDMDITGTFNTSDFERTNLKWFNSAEGQNAFKILKMLVSKNFDAFNLENILKKCKFLTMRDFEVTSEKAGLELDVIEKDNSGNGDFSVLNSNYTDTGAAISFFNNKFHGVG